MAVSYMAPKSVLNERPRDGDADEDLGFKKPQRIINLEDDYRRRRLNCIISPERHDPFASGEKTLDPLVRTYADVMREEALKREKDETLKLIAKKMKKKKKVVALIFLSRSPIGTHFRRLTGLGCG
ncbi:splicing factor 3B subunit 1-like [Pyrus ussuriensis x Pyrus communis]|uniref:Splicing factor 3B subunit 1-like n=1 Tax=Pyrus ussuriensis x Pyrus communis TaxID=2448454 RepID=A0A5N5G7T3_9ROSA|nr:splicing factor 3B subunit 1-like [Pyrus ussuriensis x Pyrus communis]KAB2620560.1 splicing factor 3B subunit 1-like [Pyrus ussuriensis x Pyrus communis]